ncbi:MAG: DNA mismatch repair protein MutS [Pseudomonadota bacterium]
MPEDSLYNDTATPMLRQYQRIKAMYPDTILMYRLGDFYEMFYDDAVLAANILDITLTSRNKNAPNPIPLCGVPFHSVEPYIAKLLESGKKVAICDQIEDPKQAKGVVKREVTRVLTPGVVVDGLGLDANTHNFLACIFYENEMLGLAIADVSTGFFQAKEFATYDGAIEDLCRTEPKELIIKDNWNANPSIEDLSRFLPKVLFTSMSAQAFDTQILNTIEGGNALIRELPVAARAASGVLSYLQKTQKHMPAQITEIKIGKPANVMRFDEATKRNLELIRTMRDGERAGSLLDALDRTKTAAGARTVRRWLLYPLTNPCEISKRLDAVEAILEDSTLLSSLPDILGRIYDIERITARAATACANARDLIGLRESLKASNELKQLLATGKGLLHDLLSQIDPCTDLVDAISTTIADDPPLSIREGGIIRPGVNSDLDEMRDAITHGKEIIAGIEAKERKDTGISSLKVRYNKVFGYYLEVTNTHRDKVPLHYIRKQTLTNAERYITPELKEHEERVLGAGEKSRALEYEIFTQLRDQVKAQTTKLKRTASAIASIDALTSLARIAAEYDYTKPRVDDGDVIDIKEGRHPIVERANPAERFVPNDVMLGGEHCKFMMITGPNMAGKSTVMRQTALIVLMAQMGSFVPASSARIGVVDRIFTRVGASDALAQGQSTFMVEMAEASVILRDAGPKSLVIIDEIGRGTSTFDGLAIAWAVAEDLHDRVGARTMFATHYHELTELALTKPKISNHHIAVREWNDQVIFLRRLVAGATSHSYGIQVARLAGLPSKVIERATEVLANLEDGELNEVGQPRIGTVQSEHGEGAKLAQYQLFGSSKKSEIEKRLKEIDATAITPIEALNILHELSNKVKE